MIFVSTLGFIDALFCAGLAFAVLLLKPRALSQWSFMAGMIALSAESAFHALSIQSVSAADTVHWQRLRLLATAVIPCIWLIFSLSYSRGNYLEFLKTWWPILTVSFVVPVALAVGFREDLIVSFVRSELNGNRLLGLGRAGIALNFIYLLGAILILMNLERTFRASVGTMRWRIKYMMLGLAVLFGGQIYFSSQILLYSAVNLSLVTISATGLFISCSLIALSLFRSRLVNVDVYPSQAVLQHSLTAFLGGSYLLVVGVLAKAVAALGGDTAFPFKTLLVLGGLIGVTILVLSDRVRHRTKRFVSRHFSRPLYDYRKVWSAFTEQTTSLLDESGFCRAVARLVAENFEALSVTVWLVEDDKENLVFAASTALSGSKPSDLTNPLTNVAELIRPLRAHPYPVDMDSSRESWVEILKRCNRGYFPKKGGNRVCVPMVSGGELLGVITLGDRVNAVSFSVEDYDLLKCIGDEAAARLRNIKLSQRLVQAKEMEAFQTISAFFVHDLKNTASTLSLMLQNMSVHFDDPAFRQDAVRGLSKSVTHINTLINELSVLRQQLEVREVETDLNLVVAAALTGLEAIPDLKLIKGLGPLPRILMDPEQIQKVVTNLVMNARDAINNRGEIRVETGQRNGWVVLEIADNGCGMSPEFVSRSLFKPFQTTKKKGLGIGMFHIRMIVNAHRGRIEVESESGKGTTFRVLLPLRTSGA
jgi:putative PEP-CTERM system histidine kinase